MNNNKLLNSILINVALLCKSKSGKWYSYYHLAQYFWGTDELFKGWRDVYAQFVREIMSKEPYKG